MTPAVRNTLAVIAGLIVGSFVNGTIVAVGPKLIPLPDGVDTSDMSKLAEALAKFEPRHFLSPWLAHALGTLVGAFVAAKIAVGPRMMSAMIVALFFLAGGIAMVAMVGGPLWFCALDLVGAYLPMGFVGGLLAGRWKPVMKSAVNS